MLKYIKGEKGIALVVVLVLSAVVLAIMTAMLYMITSGTQISGLQKRYKTAQQAAEGGNDVFYQIIWNGGDLTPYSTTPLNVTPSSMLSSCTGSNSHTGASLSGLATKVLTPSTSWPAGCGSHGNLLIDPTDDRTYDLKASVGNYTYYAKIVETVEGNSNFAASGAGAGATESLYTGSVITGKKGVSAIPVVSHPYMYSIEVDTENSANPDERAKFSILYQF